MRTNNPVFSRQASFQPQGQAPQYSQYGQGQQYGQAPHYRGEGFDPRQAPEPTERMTMDDVVTKTGLMLGVVAIVAAAAWMLVPPALTTAAWIVSALAALVVSFMVVGRRGVRPGMAMFYAALEGVFIGMFSRFMETMFPGIVVQAVMATFVVAALVLASYKFFGLKKHVNKMARGIMIATAAMAGVFLINFVLALFGVNTGLRSVGPDAGMLAIIVTLVAVVLAVANLMMDFSFIEDGIRNGAPAEQSWVAAFGVTVSMVWLYTELLRILSFFRQD